MTRRNIAATGARVSILDSWSMRDSWNQWELWKGGVLTVGSPADWAKRSLLTGTSCDTMSVGTDGGEERIWLHLHCNEKHFIWLHPHRKHFCEAAGFWFIMRISGKKVVLFRIRFKKKILEYPQIPKPESEGLFFFLASPYFIAAEALAFLSQRWHQAGRRWWPGLPLCPAGPFLSQGTSAKTSCGSGLWVMESWTRTVIQLIKSTLGAAMVICPL